MFSLRRLLPATLMLTLLAACSGTSMSPVADLPDAEVPDAEVPDAGSDGAEVEASGPHALGTIVLGESHASGASASRAIVSVSFVPDAAAQKACTRVVAGCELTVAPRCTACKAGETCVMDATCAAKCQPACTLGCDADEVCTFEGAKQTCKKHVSFDAGPVAISGATTPITLYPPYLYDTDNDGAPFLAGAELRVQGSGATVAGFEKFDETLTATRFLQTSPPLAKLPRASVFGPGALPLTWLPGNDAIVVTVAGEGGSLRCKAPDAAGRFEVPREVIKTALGASTSLALTLARERTELKKGKKTKGTLENVEVPPVGWLSLATTSIETTTFQCSGAECTGEVTPGDACNDCRTSLCKTEFDICTADATCPMLRTCLDGCADSTCRNTCFTKWPDPIAKAKNGALYKCQCINRCVSQCTVECR